MFYPENIQMILREISARNRSIFAKTRREFDSFPAKYVGWSSE